MLNAGTVQSFATVNINGFKKGMRDMKRQGDRSSTQVESRFDKMGRKLAMVGAQAAAALGASFVAISGMAIKQAAEFEKLEIQINTLTGSAEKGAKVFKQLKEFSAGTPFQLQDLVKANNTLIGMGASAEDAFKNIQVLGDIASATGANINELAITFGQASAEGKLMTRDIREFINRGVPLTKLLADSMGVAKSEIFDLASQSKITFEVLQQALEEATSGTGIYASATEKAADSISGSFSTLRDNVSMALAEYGNLIVESIGLKEISQDLAEDFGDLATSLSESGEAAEEAADFFRGLGVILSGTNTAIQNTIGWVSYLDKTLSALTISDEFKKAFTFTDEIGDLMQFIKNLGAAAKETEELVEESEGLIDIDKKMNNIVSSTKKTVDATEEATQKAIAYKQAISAIEPSNTIFDPSFATATIEPMQNLTDIVRNLGEQDYTQRLSDDFGKLPEKIEKANEAGRFFTRTLADGLEGVLFRAQSVGDAIKGIIRQLASRALTTGIFSLLGGVGAGGGFLASMFGGTFHTGGIVPGVGEKNVNVRGGEAVLTQQQVKGLQMGGGGAKELKLTINIRGGTEVTGDTIRTVFDENVRQLARLQ